MKWYQLPKEQVLNDLQVIEEQGLRIEQREQRLTEDGSNLLTGEKVEGSIKKF